jgi:hypothetical protein
MGKLRLTENSSIMHGGEMRKLAERMAILGVSATVATTMLGLPAHAAANPYTAALACNNDFGGAWANTTDGHRAIKDLNGATVANVYLMYNGATGDNCAVTLKSIYIGSPTGEGVGLLVQGSTWVTQGGEFKYYAAVRANATDRCVQYFGTMQVGGLGGAGGSLYRNGRTTWGNCG